MDWAPPKEFDDYVVLQQLGVGSNGSVWLAEDVVLARHVAIKFPSAPGPDAADRQRFLIEARAAARIQHPNVVAIYGVGELGDRPYLVYEFVRGSTLDRATKPLPSHDALRIAVDLARGLSAAHRGGVLHCDLKPANAIVGHEGAAKLLDFGLATLVQRGEDRDAGRVVPEGLSGTPGYLAPEIWRGEPHTRRSDVYAFGAVLHELCSGRAPFGDLALPDLARAVREREPAPLPSGADATDARIAAIVGRCLRRDPAERFASADELRDALEELQRGGAGAIVVRGNPYRGLRAFQADHRALFFGRAAEIGVAVDRLRSEAFLLVTGDSGVGKSSLCRAGILPGVAEGLLRDGRAWTVVTTVPGRQPLGSVCAAVADLLEDDASSLAAAVRDDPAALARALRRRVGKNEGVLLFLDQIEELITIADPAEALVADAALAELTAGAPGLRLLGTVRADFLARFARLPRLADDLSRVLYFLRPLSPDRIREVIVGPARFAGVRFETEQLVKTLVDTTATADGGLPLLQFALAELWERRDTATETITEAALNDAGGVAGALARHADAVIARLTPTQRARARRMLLRLVTLEGTRARRSELELSASDEDARGALDALVRGRLVVAQDGDDGSAYELAHEVLVHGWSTLGRWLAEEKEQREQREALAHQAAEWARLSRSDEALLGAQQLRAVEALAADDLTPLESELLAASRRAVRRRRAWRWGMAAALPAIAVAAWAAAAATARSDTTRNVAATTTTGRAALARARAQGAEMRRTRGDAFTQFDERDPGAEETWARAVAAADASDREYGAASAALEAALALDPAQSRARGELADALYERAVLAEEWHRGDRRDELVQRFSLYDADGSRRRRWREPAILAVRSDPPDAEVRLAPAMDHREAAPADPARTPLSPRPVAPGAWVLDVVAEGRAPARLVLQVSRGERLDVSVALPEASAVSKGFVYVPAGRFQFGSAADEETRKGFLNAQPLHEVRTRAFLVARTEVTYGDWIAWLDTLPAAERARRAPAVVAGPGTPGAVRLRRSPAGWDLLLQPGPVPLVARWREPLVYPRRERNGKLDWLRLPVAGVSAQDVEAFAAWLRRTARVPGARLCSELEWERAARGADDRPFPGGVDLAPEDANYDASYGKEAVGPDPVGVHPKSRSPYGIDDASGNVFELTVSVEPGRYVARGGSYWHDRRTAQISNREVVTPTMRDATVGARLCASVDE